MSSGPVLAQMSSSGLGFGNSFHFRECGRFIRIRFIGRDKDEGARPWAVSDTPEAGQDRKAVVAPDK